MLNPIVHVEFQVSDGKRAQEWYHKLFGWEMQHIEPMNYIIFDSKDGHIGGGLNPTDKLTGTIVYIRVDDVYHRVNMAKEHGAEIVREVAPIPDVGWFALIKDLDGNILGLIDDSEKARSSATKVVKAGEPS
ncbi:MAG: hypothetical protein CUN54_02750 [Phototrophicales bacterium]|nr:MAG: hypothetical protein CUN54_02750 [Phototrophicales bacterium]